MDSGTETPTKEEVVQPVEVVETKAEVTEANPQAEAIEQEELYVDEDEGDQEKPTTGMTQAQAYAAFQKEKRKRKDKQEQIDKDTVEKENLRKELLDLKAQVGNITRGEMPDPYDFDNKEDHYKALKEWEGAAPQTASKNEAEPQQDSADDEAEFYLYQKEQELTKALPDYQKSKDALLQVFKDDGMTNPKAAMNFLSNIAQQKGVDIAKAVMTMERIPSLLEDIKQAGNNHFMIGDILEKAANKVKTRTKKPINTQPEPEINSTGAIDGGNEAVNKLRQQWVANPSKHNYNLYQKAKKNKVKS
ncbi:MAG: hypothetical protein CMJ25_13645 [Phycisphaerae bacterium]|nr:hypothetical protein [Phycisphaerae bacterium]